MMPNFNKLINENYLVIVHLPINLSSPPGIAVKTFDEEEGLIRVKKPALFAVPLVQICGLSLAEGTALVYEISLLAFFVKRVSSCLVPLILFPIFTM